MSEAISSNTSSQITKITFNWPVVGALLFLTAIPALPAAFILTMLIIGMLSGGEVSSLVNVLYFEMPAAILLHGSSGILFFLTMPFQFSPALRMKKLRWHKTGGRIAFISGYAMALSGIWMHHVLSPDDLGMRYVSLVIMSMAMCAAFSLALWHITQRNIAAHGKWVIRAVAITLAAITPLFIEGVMYLLFGAFDSIISILNQWLHDYGRLIAITVNLAVVEYFIFNKPLKTQESY